MTVLFLISEAVLYAAFLTADFLGFPGSAALKYTSILLCLAFALWRTRQGGERLVAAALALTAGADLFLLVLGTHFALGILLFLGVQALYALRLRRETGKLWLPGRIALVLGAWALLALLHITDPDSLLAAVYFPQLVCSAVLAWSVPAPWGRRFALGLTLFIGCDVCVGLWNLPLMLPPGIRHGAGLGMWLFYLPSQVLIALSARPAGKFEGPVCQDG